MPTTRHENKTFLLTSARPTQAYMTYLGLGPNELHGQHWPEPQSQQRTDATSTGGMFFTEFTTPQWTQLDNKPRSVGIMDVLDGTSNTAMFAEVKRGLFGGSQASAILASTSAERCRQRHEAATLAATGKCIGNPATILARCIATQVCSTFDRSPSRASTRTQSSQQQHDRLHRFDKRSCFVSQFSSWNVNVGYADGSVRVANSSISCPSGRTLCSARRWHSHSPRNRLPGN